MFVCGVEYCDFCVCTFPKQESLPHVECIERNEEFWGNCQLKAKIFFDLCLLPELMGNDLQLHPKLQLQAMLANYKQSVVQDLQVKNCIAIVMVLKKDQ